MIGWGGLPSAWDAWQKFLLSCWAYIGAHATPVYWPLFALGLLLLFGEGLLSWGRTLVARCRGFSSMPRLHLDFMTLQWLKPPGGKMATLRVRNVPLLPSTRTKAAAVKVALLFYDKNGSLRIGPLTGGWISTREESSTVALRIHTPVDIDNQEERDLALCLQYEGEEQVFAFGTESCFYWEWKNPDFMLGREFTVQIVLKGQNVECETWWSIQSDGKDFVGQEIQPPTRVL